MWTFYFFPLLVFHKSHEKTWLLFLNNSSVWDSLFFLVTCWDNCRWAMEEIEHSSAEIGKHASDVCGRWLMLYRLQRLVLWNAGIKALWGFCRLALTIVSHKTWTHTLYQSGILLLVVLAHLSPGRVAVCRFRAKKPLSCLNCQCHRSSFARPSREDIFVAVHSFYWTYSTI